jgi:diguanylate cyclase (GGDEF)-like protein
MSLQSTVIQQGPLEANLSNSNLDEHQLKVQLKQCKNLPSLPGVAFELLKQFRGPEVNLGETADIIQKDPALAAAMLRFVNSPAFGVRREITSVTHAISLLGLNAIRTLALSFSLVRGLRRTDEEGFDYARFWQRSLLSAIAARCLGTAKGAVDREGLFLAGLLQDIGMLALQVLVPERYGELNRLAGGDHTKLYELEQETLGADHAVVGSWLAEVWEIPELYQSLILGSHDPERVEVTEELGLSLECVVLSGWFAEIWLDQSAAMIHLKSRAWMHLMAGMQSEELQAIATDMHKLMEDFPTLFEIEVGNCEKADEILLEARDQLVANSLANVHQARQVELEREELASENVQLRERSYTDSLTGVYNRSYLDDFLVDQFVRNAALDKPTSVIFCDLNDFKAINDTYGHQIGDEALTCVAGVITNEIRQTDQAVRFGGDEFVIVLQEADTAVTSKIAQRIDHAVKEVSLQSEAGEHITISTSVGYATHNRENPFHCLEALCHAADVALYKEKRSQKEARGISDPALWEESRATLRVV